MDKPLSMDELTQIGEQLAEAMKIGFERNLKCTVNLTSQHCVSWHYIWKCEACGAEIETHRGERGGRPPRYCHNCGGLITEYTIEEYPWKNED